MSTAAVVLLAIALVVVAASAAVVSAMAWRVFSPASEAPQEPTADAVSPGDEAAASEDAPAIPNLIFAPEYLDSDALTTLGAELGIDVDPVRIETMTGEQRALETASGIEGRLTLPGVAELASNVSAAETTTTLSQQAVAATHRRGFTPLITDVTRELSERGQLRTDLVAIPEEARDLATFADGLIIFYEQWGLKELPPTPQASPPTAGDQLLRALAATPAPAPPTPTPEQLLRDSADLLWRRTLEEIVAVKQRELAMIAQQGGITYALEAADWRVASDPTGDNLRLYNSRLHTRNVGPRAFNLQARAVVNVPLNPQRLTDSGRQQLTPGALLFLAVFGRIGPYSEADGTLMLHPIAIFSG